MKGDGTGNRGIYGDRPGVGVGVEGDLVAVGRHDVHRRLGALVRAGHLEAVEPRDALGDCK